MGLYRDRQGLCSDHLGCKDITTTTENQRKKNMKITCIGSIYRKYCE